MTEEEFLLEMERLQIVIDYGCDFEKAPVAVAPPATSATHLELGMKYAVPCVFMRSLPDVPMPVLDVAHNDGRDWLACGGEHFHVDFRFIGPRRLEMFASLPSADDREVGYNWTLAVDTLTSAKPLVLDRVFFKPHPGAVESVGGPSFPKRFEGRSALWDEEAGCFRCPHQQTPLQNVPDADGLFTCPAHFLRFDEGRVCIGSKECS